MTYKTIASVIITWEHDQHQLTAEDSPAGPFKVRDNAPSHCDVVSQGVSFSQAAQCHIQTKARACACTHAHTHTHTPAFPWGALPDVRLTKVCPGLSSPWNCEARFPSNP